MQGEKEFSSQLFVNCQILFLILCTSKGQLTIIKITTLTIITRKILINNVLCNYKNSKQNEIKRFFNLL